MTDFTAYCSGNQQMPDVGAKLEALGTTQKKRPNLGWDLSPGHRTMPFNELLSMSTSNALTEELLSAQASPFSDESSCFDRFHSPTRMLGRTGTTLSLFDEASSPTGACLGTTLFTEYASFGVPPKRAQSPMANTVRVQPMSPAVVSPQNKSPQRSCFAEDSSPLHKSPLKSLAEDSAMPNKALRRSVFAEDSSDVTSSPKESAELSANNSKPVPAPLGSCQDSPRDEVNVSPSMLLLSSKPPLSNTSSPEGSAWGGSTPDNSATPLVSPANSSKPWLGFGAALGDGAKLILSVPGEEEKESLFSLDLANPVHTRIVMDLIRRHEPLVKSAAVECCGKPQPAGSVEGPADGKFPVYESGRCSHNAFWVRLRGKRGHSYFCCTYCGVGWRQPTKAKQKSFEQKQAANSEGSPSLEDNMISSPCGSVSDEAPEETQLGLLLADLGLE